MILFKNKCFRFNSKKSNGNFLVSLNILDIYLLFSFIDVLTLQQRINFINIKCLQ